MGTHSSDLKIIVIWVLATFGAIYLPFLNQSPLRIVIVVPSIILIPGYALVAALYPRNSELDTLERVALSLGVSIAVVPLIGFGLNFTPGGISLDPIVLSLAAFTIAFSAIAFVRRDLLPAQERFSPSLNAVLTRVTGGISSHAPASADRALNILLLVAVIAAIGATAYVIVVPNEEQRYTDFFILGSTGGAGSYPVNMASGKNYSISLGVGNHEFREVNYTIEIWTLVMIQNEVTNSSEITTMDLLDRFPVSLAHNETMIIPYNLSVAKPGYNRIEFLLFDENVPPDTLTGGERITASYRDLHLWITMRS